MTGRAGLLAVLALLAVAPSACAQSGGDFFFSGVSGGGSVTVVPVTVDGALTVDFHSDPASCAAAGRCGLAGTVSWRPTHKGQLVVFENRRAGHRRADGYFFPSELGYSEGGPLLTVARVQRTGTTGDGLCADGNQDAAALAFEGTGDSLDVGLRGAGGNPLELLATRCAGPLARDVAAALPSRRMSAATLRRGGRTVDLSSDAPFTAAGFTGTARSNVVLHLGNGRVQRDQPVPRRTRFHRRRSVEAEYRIERVSGTVSVDVQSDPATAACGPLDACGLSGTEILSPRLRRGSASLYANALATHSDRQLRAAIGLVPGGRPRGISVLGSGQFDDAGEASVTIGRLGEPACTDRVPVGAGALLLSVQRTTVHASYTAFTGIAGALRTRCPGPALAESLAAGSVPLQDFARARVTLRLASGTRQRTDGYTARSAPGLTVVLRRTKVRERIIREPILGPPR